MGFERPGVPHPGPASALRWSGGLPGEAVGLRPADRGWNGIAAAAPSR